MKSGSVVVKTKNTMELIDITQLMTSELRKSSVERGVCLLFNPHTTAGLTINEGADPAVRVDIIDGFKKMVPLHHPFKHLEGNSPAHIMASLMGSSLTIAVDNSTFVLGTWHIIFFCEFDGPRTRKVHFHLLTQI